MTTPIEYQQYLASPHWKATRRAAIQRAGHRCQKCGEYWTRKKPVYLQVHHLTYARVGKERPEDLMVLCEPCHEMEHGLPEELVTRPGPELFGTILGRMIHFSQRRPPRQNAG